MTAKHHVETSLVTVKILILRVLAFVVSCELFWNWIRVMRFVSCKARVTSLTWHRTFKLTILLLLFGSNCVVVVTDYLNSNSCRCHESVNRIKHWNEMPRHKIFLWNKVRRTQDLSNKMRCRSSWWVVCPVDVVCDSVFTVQSSESYWVWLIH